MPRAIADLAARIDARARRERLLLAGTLAVIVLVVWDMAVRAPLSERHADALERMDRVESDIASLHDSRDALRRQLGDADEAPAESPAEQLRARIERIDRELTARTARLISPEQMVAALRDVVDDQSGVRLVRLENAAAEPLISVSDETGGEPATDVPRVYRHAVEVVVEGRYLDVLAYLRRLEDLEWRFGWDALSIRTESYPVTRATVSLSTLSLAEDWIGV